jgi:hypothetical protein
MNSLATRTSELELTDSGYAVAVAHDVGRARATTPAELRLADTLTLAAFSLIYESAVFVLRIRSWLSASSRQ